MGGCLAALACGRKLCSIRQSDGGLRCGSAPGGGSLARGGANRYFATHKRRNWPFHRRNGRKSILCDVPCSQSSQLCQNSTYLPGFRPSKVAKYSVAPKQLAQPPILLPKVAKQPAAPTAHQPGDNSARKRMQPPKNNASPEIRGGTKDNHARTRLIRSSYTACAQPARGLHATGALTRWRESQIATLQPRTTNRKSQIANL